MRKVDYVSVYLCAFAAGLCYAGSWLASFVFVLSSCVGLFDSIKNKVIPAAMINGIFLTLNFLVSVEFLLN